MSDQFDINVYLKGTAGSISGWDLHGVVDPTLTEVNQSVDVLIRYLQKLVDQDAPSKIRLVERQALRHIRDSNNPHHDTVENLTDGDIGLLFQKYLPGTVPLAPPDYTYAAFWEMGAPFSNAVVMRTSEMNVIDEQGFLSYVGPNEAGVDWSEGYPQVPCWPAIVELIDDTNFISNPKFSFPGLVTSVAQMSGVTPTQFGMRVKFTETTGQQESAVTYTNVGVLVIGQAYTFNLFVNPTTHSSGSFYLDANDAHAFINVADFDDTLVTDGSQFHVQKLANGWLRFGLSFVADKADVVLKFGYEPHTYTNIADAVAGIGTHNRTYITRDGVDAFTLFGPNLVDKPGLPPFIQSGSLAETRLVLPGCVGSVALDKGMIAWRGQLFFSPADKDSGNLLNAGNCISLSARAGAVTANMEVATPAIPIGGFYNNKDYFQLGVSYDKTKLALNTSVSGRTDITSFGTSTYRGADAFKNVTIGPFCGGISHLVHYAVSDDDHALEFLNG